MKPTANAHPSLPCSPTLASVISQSLAWFHHQSCPWVVGVSPEAEGRALVVAKGPVAEARNQKTAVVCTSVPNSPCVKLSPRGAAGVWESLVEVVRSLGTLPLKKPPPVTSLSLLAGWRHKHSL